MRSVVLSTTEEEYVAVSKVLKEISFIVQLLQTVDIEVELPVKVYVDDIGAILLATNQTTSKRAKHVGVQHHYVCEKLIEGMKSNQSNTYILNPILVGFSRASGMLIWIGSTGKCNPVCGLVKRGNFYQL
jgi:hypothetical protein